MYSTNYSSNHSSSYSASHFSRYSASHYFFIATLLCTLVATLLTTLLASLLGTRLATLNKTTYVYPIHKVVGSLIIDPLIIFINQFFTYVSCFLENTVLTKWSFEILWQIVQIVAGGAILFPVWKSCVIPSPGWSSVSQLPHVFQQVLKIHYFIRYLPRLHGWSCPPMNPILHCYVWIMIFYLSMPRYQPIGSLLSTVCYNRSRWFYELYTWLVILISASLGNGVCKHSVTTSFVVLHLWVLFVCSVWSLVILFSMSVIGWSMAGRTESKL